jgi:hypothetical protein
VAGAGAIVDQRRNTNIGTGGIAALVIAGIVMLGFGAATTYVAATALSTPSQSPIEVTKAFFEEPLNGQPDVSKMMSYVCAKEREQFPASWDVLVIPDSAGRANEMPAYIEFSDEVISGKTATVNVTFTWVEDGDDDTGTVRFHLVDENGWKLCGTPDYVSDTFD